MRYHGMWYQLLCQTNTLALRQWPIKKIWEIGRYYLIGHRVVVGNYFRRICGRWTITTAQYYWSEELYDSLSRLWQSLHYGTFGFIHFYSRMITLINKYKNAWWLFFKRYRRGVALMKEYISKRGMCLWKRSIVPCLSDRWDKLMDS